jgi:hypothetical protein
MIRNLIDLYVQHALHRVHACRRLMINAIGFVNGEPTMPTPKPEQCESDKKISAISEYPVQLRRSPLALVSRSRLP